MFPGKANGGKFGLVQNKIGRNAVTYGDTCTFKHLKFIE